MRLYEITPYSHRQHYAIKRVLGKATGVQSGSGFADALGKIGSIAGKIASNPGVQNLGRAGLEIGTTLAGQAIAQKVAQSGHPNIAGAIQAATQNPGETLSSLLQQRDEVKANYKNGSLTKAQAIELLRKIDSMRQSGGVRSLKSVARHQYEKGNVMSIRPVRMHRQNLDPIDVNTAGGVHMQVGGILPALIPLGIAGASAGIGLLSSLLGPVLERVSQKHIANSI